eukprot:CAMPEP_0174250454 /NCGR_PEP_ID=MMETSP0439-20130205/620_1 /TAXON_ID=0 /ORGANISM="Stereomyxa ramosa, Strain Chinc5" /LENGTH=945 /DNA_ID=CAMNT_0015330527 /DNA_START=33 /DNA_END=2867 /DNA_ORIENTATION=-
MKRKVVPTVGRGESGWCEEVGAFGLDDGSLLHSLLSPPPSPPPFFLLSSCLSPKHHILFLRYASFIALVDNESGQYISCIPVSSCWIKLVDDTLYFDNSYDVNAFDVNERRVVQVFRGHRKFVTHMCWSANVLYTCSTDGTCKSWHAVKWKKFGLSLNSQRGNKKVIAAIKKLHCDTIGEEEEESTRKENESEMISELVSYDLRKPLTCCVVDHSNTFVFLSSTANAVYCYHLISGDCFAIFSGHQDWVLGLKIYNETLFTLSRDRSVISWNISNFVEDSKRQTGGESEGIHDIRSYLRRFPVECDQQIKPSDFKIFSNLLFVVCNDANPPNVKIFNTKSGKNITKFGDTSTKITKIKIIKDKSLLVVGYANGEVAVWDCKLERQVTSFRAHEQEVSSIVYDKESSKLYTTATDTTVKIWKVHKTAPYPAATMRPSRSPPSSHSARLAKNYSSPSFIHEESTFGRLKTDSGASSMSRSAPGEVSCLRTISCEPRLEGSVCGSAPLPSVLSSSLTRSSGGSPLLKRRDLPNSSLCSATRSAHGAFCLTFARKVKDLIDYVYQSQFDSVVFLEKMTEVARLAADFSHSPSVSPNPLLQRAKTELTLQIKEFVLSGREVNHKLLVLPQNSGNVTAQDLKSSQEKFIVVVKQLVLLVKSFVQVIDSLHEKENEDVSADNRHNSDNNNTNEEENNEDNKNKHVNSNNSNNSESSVNTVEESFHNNSINKNSNNNNTSNNNHSNSSTNNSNVAMESNKTSVKDSDNDVDDNEDNEVSFISGQVQHFQQQNQLNSNSTNNSPTQQCSSSTLEVNGIGKIIFVEYKGRKYCGEVLELLKELDLETSITDHELIPTALRQVLAQIKKLPIADLSQAEVYIEELIRTLQTYFVSVKAFALERLHDATSHAEVIDKMTVVVVATSNFVYHIRKLLFAQGTSVGGGSVAGLQKSCVE